MLFELSRVNVAVTSVDGSIWPSATCEFTPAPLKFSETLLPDGTLLRVNVSFMPTVVDGPPLAPETFMPDDAAEPTIEPLMVTPPARGDVGELPQPTARTTTITERNDREERRM